MAQQRLAWALAVAAVAALAANALAQFEVATVKPRRDVDQGPLDRVERDFLKLRIMRSRPATDRFRIPNITLQGLIEIAYGVRESQVEGGPSWVRSERYEVDAKLPEGVTTLGQLRFMLRSLMDERFRLAIRRETRTKSVYSLVPGAAGIKIAPMKEGDCVTARPDVPMPPPGAIVFYCGGFNRVFASPPPDRIDRIAAGNVTMQALVDFIADDVERVVVDKTGFTAPFNLLLTYAPLIESTDPTLRSSGPSIFSALQEQLGLRLVSTEAPVEMLVIERAERPTDN